MEKESIKDAKLATPATPPVLEVQGKTSPIVRTATKEQFKKAHAKTSVQHADLFRRLAK